MEGGEEKRGKVSKGEVKIGEIIVRRDKENEEKTTINYEHKEG